MQARKGRLLRKRGRLVEALECFRKALEFDAGYARAYAGLGATFVQLGQLESGLASYHQALFLEPDDARILNSVGCAYLLQARLPQAVEHFTRAIEKHPEYPSAYSNYFFAQHFDADCSPAARFQRHLEFGRQFEKLQSTAPHINDRDPARRLRIGYVSGDFYHHPVSFFFESILANYSREQFEVTCYSCMKKEPDSVTRRLQKFADRWRSIRRQSDEAADALIRADEIDILVDLSGHTGESRLPLFARKPAPVQVTYLGYPSTTGLAAIDYRITDAFADPPGCTEQFHTEKLIRLSDSFLCYRPPRSAPAVCDPPMTVSGRVTFGSFSKPLKWNSEVIRCWSRILRRVPDSRLILHHGIGSRNENLSAEIHACFRRENIPDDRVEIVGRLRTRDHLGLYNQVDLNLDPFPYNGTTATCEALWMGVPSIVLEGSSHVSRVGVSLMSNVHLDRFIARDINGYVEIASRAVDDRKDMRSLRHQLRTTMANSALMDVRGFTYSLEQAYRSMWRRACKSPGIKTTVTYRA